MAISVTVHLNHTVIFIIVKHSTPRVVIVRVQCMCLELLKVKVNFLCGKHCHMLLLYQSI